MGWTKDFHDTEQQRQQGRSPRLLDSCQILPVLMSAATVGTAPRTSTAAETSTPPPSLFQVVVCEVAFSFHSPSIHLFSMSGRVNLHASSQGQGILV